MTYDSPDGLALCLWVITVALLFPEQFLLLLSEKISIRKGKLFQDHHSFLVIVHEDGPGAEAMSIFRGVHCSDMESYDLFSKPRH